MVKFVNEEKAVIKTPLQTTPALLERLESSPQLQQTSGIGCELCTIVLTAARHLLENKVDDEKILDFVETQLCSRLGKYQNTCVEYVKGEGELILEMLAQQVDPALICRGMGLCLKVQVSDTQVNEQFFDLQVRNAVNCTLCKMVVTEVKHMITDNKKQAEIIAYINTNLCEKVGRTKELCKSLIDAYGPLFLEIIARDVNPTQLCTMIGMCDKHTVASTPISFIALEKSRPLIKRTEATVITANTTCVMCEFVLNVLSRYIDQNSTEPEIEALLMKVCSEFPSSVKAECSTFVTQYGPIIVSLLIKEVESDKICAEINLCPKGGRQQVITNVNPFQRQHESSKLANLECTVCEYSIEYLYLQYSVEQTEKQIEFSINNVCKFTPISYRHYCDKMVTTYGKGLIDFLRKEMSSENVCKQVHMCKSEPVVALEDLMPAKVIKEKKNFFEETSNVKNGSIECSLCVYVAGLVDAKLMDNKTEEQIVEELKLACNLFPTTLKDQCESFINEYGPYIVQLVAQDLDPQSTCASLKLCDVAIEESTINRLYKKFHQSN
jgi:saposin